MMMRPGWDMTAVRPDRRRCQAILGPAVRPGCSVGPGPDRSGYPDRRPPSDARVRGRSEFSGGRPAPPSPAAAWTAPTAAGRDPTDLTRPTAESRTGGLG